jgi:hypothetical protein
VLQQRLEQRQQQGNAFKACKVSHTFGTIQGSQQQQFS